MDEPHSKSVVVGIDGSEAAVNAAKWAIDEAVNRRIPLRLVHVIGPRGERIAAAGVSASELESAEMALCQAEKAVLAEKKPVDVETAVLAGDLPEVLIDESRDAAMVCVGTERRGWQLDLLSPTAAALAARAHCPVAIIRTGPDGTLTADGVIAVVLNDDPDNDEVVHHAMEEGRRRKAIVRQIDHRQNSWIRRYPDVSVQTVASGTDVNPGEKHSSAIQLAVVGETDAEQIAGLTVPNCHPIVGYPNCSVLLVRH